MTSIYVDAARFINLVAQMADQHIYPGVPITPVLNEYVPIIPKTVYAGAKAVNYIITPTGSPLSISLQRRLRPERGIYIF